MASDSDVSPKAVPRRSLPMMSNSGVWVFGWSAVIIMKDSHFPCIPLTSSFSRFTSPSIIRLFPSVPARIIDFPSPFCAGR